MSRPLVVLLLLVSALGATPAFGQAPSSATALLLGIRYEEPVPAPLPYYVLPADSLARPVYRTLLIVKNEDGDVEAVADRPGLIVPRRSGLWQVDTRRSVYNNWVEDFLTSAPLGGRSDAVGIQAYNGEFCQGHRVQVIHFAGPSYLGVEQRTAGYCEDAPHPWYTNNLAVIPVDSTAHTGLSISRVVGRTGRDALLQGARTFLSSLTSAKEREAFFPEPDEANWTVVRRSGQWSLKGRLESGEVANPRHADFQLALKPPASVVGHDELALSWDRVRRAIPDAVDAISSPRNDFVVVLRPGHLTVHLILRDRLGPQVLDLEIASSSTFVMTQWSSTNAATWARALQDGSQVPAIGWQAQRE